MTYSPIAVPLPLSDRFSVRCQSTEYPVYKGMDFDFVHLTTLDILSVEVTVSMPIDEVALRPSRRQKAYTVQGNTISLSLARGDYFCLEINGDIERPLLLFVDEPVTAPLLKDYTLMSFTEPGYYDVGKIEVTSNFAVYIAEGAFVNAFIDGENAHNVRIFGGGTLLRKNTEGDRHHPINLVKCDHVDIRGITVINNNAWNIRLNDCHYVTVEDVKILADEIWSDGIDIVGGEHVLLRHLFIKNEDDCVCLKSSFNISRNFEGFDVRHVLVEDCVLWNGPRGNSLEIGYETNNAVVEDVHFRNVDVVHRETQESKFHRSIISIHNAGNATIRDITYENIYAESTDENFVQISHMHQPRWGLGNGRIEDITIRNLTLAGGELRPSRVSAHAPNGNLCTTKNVTFENLTVLGTPIRSTEDAAQAGFTVDPATENVRFL